MTDDIRRKVYDLAAAWNRMEKAKRYRDDSPEAAKAADEAKLEVDSLALDLAATFLTDVHRIADAMATIAKCVHTDREPTSKAIFKTG